MTQNLSIFAIPVYWAITIIPHSYAIAIVQKASNGKWDNASPRSSHVDARLQKSIPTAIYQRYERAEAAHKNGFESFPLIAGAILAGNLAKLSPGYMNTFAGVYLAMRVLYTFVYIGVEKQSTSYFRSLIWFSSSLACVTVFVKAGIALM